MFFLYKFHSVCFFGFDILIFSWLVELRKSFSVLFKTRFGVPHQSLADEVVFDAFNKKTKFFLEIVLFSWAVEFLESILAFTLKDIWYIPTSHLLKSGSFLCFDKKKSL